MSEQIVKTEKQSLSPLFKSLGIASLLLLPFACGFVSYLDSAGKKIRRSYHDHSGKTVEGSHVLGEHYEEVPYDPAVHGEVEDSVAEGAILTNYPTAKGRVNRHRHPGQGYPVVAYGPYEVRNEAE